MNMSFKNAVDINELVDKVDKTKSNAMILRYMDMEFGCSK